jgi:hypothetical protein
MLVSTNMYIQSAAVIFKIHFCSTQPQQIVYKPHDVLSSVGNAGSKSSSFMLSSANASRWRGLDLGRGIYESTFAAGKLPV